MEVQDTRISTGVKELDLVLGGGLRRNSVILVSGNPGSGKTILSTQFLEAGGSKGERSIYVSFAEKQEDFFNNMATLNLAVRSYAEKGVFRFLEFPTLDREGMTKTIEIITEQITEFEPKRLVIDSISAFTQSMGTAETRQFLHLLFGRILKDMDVTTILIGEMPLGQKRTGLGVEEFVVDGVILLRYSRNGKLERREMDIVKMRGVALIRSHYEYSIHKRYRGIGLIVLPTRSDIRHIATDKVTSGIEGLDKILNGGVYRGSLSLIEGASGIGKTTLSIQFLIKNAEQGKRCLFLSFEEPIGQIIRLMENHNWDYKSLDNFSIEAYVPESFTPLHYYNLIREIVEDKEPSILAIDSITAIQHILKNDDFVEFVRYLQLLCKDKGLTVYLTSLHAGDMYTGAGVSTLADNIIRMRYVEAGDRFDRELYVIKTRGSAHSKNIAGFEITDEGFVMLG